jgi:hypothetical protein
MGTRAGRLALLAAAGVSTLALSGCHEVFFLGFDVEPDDPPVHRVDGGASPGTATASAGERFRGRADGQLASRMKVGHGFVTSKTSWARFTGSYTSNLSGSPLASAQWHGRFRSIRNRATGRFTIKGLVLATFTDAAAGRACLELTSKGVRKQNRRPRRPARTAVTVVGGEGGARRLRGRATARVRLARDNSLRLRGTVRSRQGTARAFTPACARLARRFGLAPLPDA